jgi:hypothetical protein
MGFLIMEIVEIILGLYICFNLFFTGIASAQLIAACTFFLALAVKMCFNDYRAKTGTSAGIKEIPESEPDGQETDVQKNN